MGMLPEIRLRNFCVCIFVTVASLVALALYVSRYSESSKRVTLRGFSGHAENDGNTANYQHHSRYRSGPHNGENQRKINRVVSDILGRLGVSSTFQVDGTYDPSRLPKQASKHLHVLIRFAM